MICDVANGREGFVQLGGCLATAHSISHVSAEVALVAVVMSLAQLELA